MVSEERVVRYGGHTIRYRLSYTARSTLKVSVRPNLLVEVRAPLNTAPEAVDEKVLSRADWILRQQRDFELYHPLPQPRRFVAGETHWYLGRQYRLRIVEGPASVTVQIPFLVVRAEAGCDQTHVGTLVEKWYRERAEEVLRDRVAHCMRVARALLRTTPRVRIRKMSSRWGSCSPSGTVTLNPDLVKASTLCIDYVIIHELCHVHEPSHGAAFYDLLQRYLPDWERRREQLNHSLR